MTIDVDGGDISLQDAGTKWGQLYNSSGNFVIYNPTSDKDIYIRGNDGGSPFNAVHFDMSSWWFCHLFSSKITATNLVLSNLSSVAEATSLMIQSDGTVVTRELGSNAFNSTSIPTALTDFELGEVNLSEFNNDLSTGATLSNGSNNRVVTATGTNS